MKIGIIGVGHMGSAIIEGLKHNPQNEIVAFNHPNNRVKKISENLNFKYFINISEFLVTKPEVIILTTPAKVTLDIVKNLANTTAIIISAAAGISYANFRKILPKAKIVRIIPNIPVKINQGTISVAWDDLLTSEDKDFVLKLLNSLGDVIEVKEDNLSIASTISGCGPAFVDVFLDALSDAGVLNGLNKEAAVKVAASMIKGSATLALNDTQSPANLKDEVASPGGTTIKGIVALEKNNFRYSIIDAVNKSNKN